MSWTLVFQIAILAVLVTALTNHVVATVAVSVTTIVKEWKS